MLANPATLRTLHLGSPASGQARTTCQHACHGVLLKEAQNVQTVGTNPWLILPVFAVIITVLAYNFLGDGLRDAAAPYR